VTPEGAMRPADAPDRESSAGGDVEPAIRVWLRLLTCSTMIEAEVRRLLQREYATTLPRFDALAQLDRAPDGLTMTELSRRMMVTNGNITGVVDRLVADGLVTRHPAPDDRRALIAMLTPRGRKVFGEMTPHHHAEVSRMFDHVPPKELAQIYELLGTVKDSLRAYAVSANADHKERKK